MTELDVITKTLIYLIKEENFDVKQVSIQKIEDRESLKQSLTNVNINKDMIENIKFSHSDADIIGHLSDKNGKIQHKLHIEAKGNDGYIYHFYTALGQLILGKKRSSYQPYAIAVPESWKEKLKEKLKEEKSNKIKPLVERIMKFHDGLFFIFVSDKTVEKITWKNFLK